MTAPWEAVTLKEIKYMSASRSRLSRFLADSRPQCDPVFHSVSDFYREEFVKCRRCLEQQREYYSERAITDVDAAIARILARLEQLCSKDDADQLMSGLLRKFDSVTGLSAWSDPSKLH